jgi:hypothetical protein
MSSRAMAFSPAITGKSYFSITKKNKYLNMFCTIKKLFDTVRTFSNSKKMMSITGNARLLLIFRAPLRALNLRLAQARHGLI